MNVIGIYQCLPTHAPPLKRSINLEYETVVPCSLSIVEWSVARSDSPPYLKETAPRTFEGGGGSNLYIGARKKGVYSFGPNVKKPTLWANGGGGYRPLDPLDHPALCKLLIMIKRYRGPLIYIHRLYRSTHNY